MPNTRLCFAPPAIEITGSSTPPVSYKRHITFGCFQKLSKVTDDVLATWGRIFHALPQARLRIQSKQLNCESARERLQQCLTQVGISPDRVTTLGSIPREEYFLAYNNVDIVLDTFPFPGGTTTCEALWMGVPTLTLAGETMLARQGASLLTCVGMKNWIASDADDYVAKALAHAADSQQLTALRSSLRHQFLTSPLCDAPLFSRNLEAAFQDMWQRYCSKNSTG